MLGPGFLLLAHLNAAQRNRIGAAQEWRKLVRMLKCDEGEEGLPYIEPKGESNTKDAQGTDAPGNGIWRLWPSSSSPWSSHVVVLVWCCGRCCEGVGGGDRGVFGCIWKPQQSYIDITETTLYYPLLKIYVRAGEVLHWTYTIFGPGEWNHTCLRGDWGGFIVLFFLAHRWVSRLVPIFFDPLCTHVCWCSLYRPLTQASHTQLFSTL